MQFGRLTVADDYTATIICQEGVTLDLEVQADRPRDTGYAGFNWVALVLFMHADQVRPPEGSPSRSRAATAAGPSARILMPSGDYEAYNLTDIGLQAAYYDCRCALQAARPTSA